MFDLEENFETGFMKIRSPPVSLLNHILNINFEFLKYDIKIYPFGRILEFLAFGCSCFKEMLTFFEIKRDRPWTINTCKYIIFQDLGFEGCV